MFWLYPAKSIILTDISAVANVDELAYHTKKEYKCAPMIILHACSYSKLARAISHLRSSLGH